MPPAGVVVLDPGGDPGPGLGFGGEVFQGPQFELPDLARSNLFRLNEDYTHYLSRLRAIPANLKQLKELLDAGRVTGLTPAQVALSRLPDQFASLVDANVAANPLFTPFLKFPAEIPAIRRTELTGSARHILQEGVVPAIRQFQSYLATVWIPVRCLPRWWLRP